MKWLIYKIYLCICIRIMINIYVIIITSYTREFAGFFLIEYVLQEVPETAERAFYACFRYRAIC